MFAFIFISFVLSFFEVSFARTTSFTQKDLIEIEKDLWHASVEELPLIEQRITRVIQTDSRSVIGYFLLNQLHLRYFRNSPTQTHIIDQAAETAFQARALDPKSPLGVIAIIDTLEAMGRNVEVASLLNNQSSDFLQDSWRYQLAKTRKSSLTSPPSQTFKNLRSIMKNPQALREVVAAYVVSLLKSEYDSIQLSQQLADWHKDFPTPTFLFAIAMNHIDNKKYRKAHKILQKLHSNPPHYLEGYEEEALINDGIVLTKNLKRHRSAIRLFKKRLEKIEDFPIPQVYILSQLHAHLGYAYLHIHQAKKANIHFIRALSLTNNRSQMLRFIQQSHKSKPNKFIEFMQSAINEVPGHAEIHASLAHAYSDSRDYKTSREYWGNAIILSPEKSSFYTSMGLSYYHTKEYEEALNWFKQATFINPNDAKAFYNLACMQSLTSNKTQALENLQKALILDPSLKSHASSDKDLLNIQDHPVFKKLVH